MLTDRRHRSVTLRENRGQLLVSWQDVSVCCTTHADRDAIHRSRGTDVDALLAASESWRCRCPFTGVRCERRATGEDLMCDWCRVTDHMAFCNEEARPWEAQVLTLVPPDISYADFRRLLAAPGTVNFLRGLPPPR